MASSETKIYHKTLGQAFAAAQKAVRDLGYKVDTLDKTSGLLNFKTGMSWKSWAGQEMSVMIIDNGNGSVEVSVSGRRNQSGVVIQIYDWGEAAGIAKKVIAKMDENMPDDEDSKVEVVRFKCLECREFATWPESDAGKKVLCMNCGTPNVVPDLYGRVPPSRKSTPAATANRRLSSCPDCDAQVSKRATQCPQCGCPFESDE